MILATLSRLVVAMAVIALCAAGDTGLGARAQEAPVDGVSVDMPHGSCRLSVALDGSARLQFGAGMWHVNIRPGTFNLPELRAALRSLVHPEATRSTLPPPVGGVVFSDDGVVLPFTDHAFAQRLFQKAWDQRATATTEIERRDERDLFRVCKLR